MNSDNQNSMPFKEGDVFTFKDTVSEQAIDDYAKITGDMNPVHVDDDYAQKTVVKNRIAYGMQVGAMALRFINDNFPGTGSLCLEQDFKFKNPVFPGDLLNFEIKIIQISPAIKSFKIEITVKNKTDKTVVHGHCLIMLL